MGSILCSYGDAFTYNLLLKHSVDTSDFYRLLGNLTRHQWFIKQKADWRHKSVELVEVLAESGKCFSVNLKRDIYREEMFVIEGLSFRFTIEFIFSISEDFHFHQSIKLELGSDQSSPQNALTFSFVDNFRRTYCKGGGGAVVVHDSNEPPTDGVDYHKRKSFMLLNALSQFIITPKITITEENLKKVDASM